MEVPVKMKLDQQRKTPKIRFLPKKENFSPENQIFRKLKQYEIRKKGNLLDEQKSIAVQLGAFRDRKWTESLVKKYKQKSNYAYVITLKGSGGVPWYKVRIGKFRDIAQANKTLERLNKDNLKPIIVGR